MIGRFVALRRICAFLRCSGVRAIYKVRYMVVLAKTMWWVLVAAAVLIALPHVNPWVGAPAALFLLAGGFGFWGDD